RDLRQNFLGIIENLLICETQYAQTLTNQVCVAILIVMPLLVWTVHRPITLDYKTSFVTIEIRYVIAKLMLASEFESKDLTISKQLPHYTFSRCLLLSQIAHHV